MMNQLCSASVPIFERLVGLRASYSSVVHIATFRSSSNHQQVTGNKDVPKAYDPVFVEHKWKGFWDDGNGGASGSRPASIFSMVLPPPNVTGKLHLGHALTLSVQDAICRWRRMLGDEVVWVPGTDHAGIATQVIVEKALWTEEQKTRHHLGRDEFLRRVWKWRTNRTEQIHDQIKALGVTLDWNRAVFTMDPAMSAAVTEAFVRLFDAGVVYRAEALVNWCCHLQSAVSDVEVDHQTIDGTMVDFAYCWEEDSSEEIVVSTTRPETLLGDTAVAVHPNDPRWRRWPGRHVIHPLRPGRPRLPVVADDVVEPDLGTGALKITPAHDPKDFEIGKRHDLEIVTVLSEDGRINENGGEFQGLTRREARVAVVEALKRLGLYRGERPHQLTVPVCSRTGDVIEPMIKRQWFVRCREMAATALQAVQTGELTVDPSSLEVVWRQWLGDCRDWCVSRQLWWGHRIPAFCVTDQDGAERWMAAATEQQAISKLGLSAGDVKSVRQDDDVMDTWFSSALFPFAVFGWPCQTADLRRCYPLTLMETGHDILFFWVARMVMLGQTLTGQLPFKRVLLHGLICDAHGRKMSKSLGNVIDPDHVIEGASLERLHQQMDTSVAQGYISPEESQKAKQGQRVLYPEGIPACGADALRLSLCSVDLRNSFISLDVREARQARLFGNKLWQACRFALTHLVATGYRCDHETRRHRVREVSGVHRWMLSCLAACVQLCSDGMESQSLHTAAAAIQHTLYGQFCDVYLEAVKLVLFSGEPAACQTACDVMLAVLGTGCRLLHPFMPHLTEELNQQLAPHSAESGSLLRQSYPSVDEWLPWRDEALEASFMTCLDAVRGLRALKAQYRVIKTAPEVYLTTQPDLSEELATVVSTLARCRVSRLQDRPDRCLLVQGRGWRAYVDLQGHVDVPLELDRLRSKKERLRTKIDALDASMNTNKFKRKSPKIKDQERERRVRMAEEVERLTECEQDISRLV